ncbi:hypothetical protein ACP70R_025441 [Stipagrostis hirtigluma subsp. patula]
MSWGRFHQGPFRSGFRPTERCSTSTEKTPPCNVVVLDEDDDGDSASDSDVVIIDGSGGEAAPVASGCQSKKGNSSSGSVINLDDDDDDDGAKEDAGGDKAGPSTAGGAGSPAATTPGRGSPRNRYGLDSTSDSSESDLSGGWVSDSGDDGSSDVEILDDASGTARKLWESAASRKKMPQGIHESKDGRYAASPSSTGSQAFFDGLFNEECNVDENISRYFSDAWKEDAQNSTGCAKDGPAEYHQNESMHFSHAWKGEQNNTGCSKDGHGASSVPYANECSNRNVSKGNGNSDAKDAPADHHLNEDIFQYFSKAKEGAQNSTGSAKDGHGPSSAANAEERLNGNVSNGKETHCSASSTLDPDMACNDRTAHPHNGAVPEKAPEVIKSPCVDGAYVFSFVSANRVFPSSFATDRKDGIQKHGSPPISVSTPEKIDEKIPEGAYSQKDQSPTDAHNVINKDVYSAQEGSVTGQQEEVPPFTSVNATSGSCSLPKNDLVDDSQGLGQSSDIPDCLIGEREKHKESAEYKRAAEEEWASRQRHLQIMAEEAKKLRKRKKAEALRLRDMEKRQKQRLQEVRESQKKNEEDIQLKEQYRGTVRKELEDMERRYRDMGSILRVLGIPVEGGKVKAAYKQAYLKFHPDRVSRSDIYQQVKAEETFKFILRLKEKLPPFL